jgi:anti-sigma-K factor RskA
MNELACREIDELLPGYASDALEEADRCAAATHLAECRNHDVELQALRLSFAGLAATVGPVEPPAALRSRLLDAFDSELAGSPVELPLRRESQPSRRFSGAAFGYALAAAMLVLAVALGAWGASRGGTEVQVVNTTDQAGSLQVVYIPSHSRGVIDYDLASLPAGRAYQAWRLDAAGNPESLGVLPGDNGSLAFEADFDEGGAVALTVEPAGGSRLPTTTPLLVTQLDES